MLDDVLGLHRRTARLPAETYVAGGSFFVTICAVQHQSLFGRIDNGAMRMNDAGWIVGEERERTAALRAEVELVAHVVIPNHFHALFSMPPAPEKVQLADAPDLYRAPRSLGALIGGFKAACTAKIIQLPGNDIKRVWQRGYWDHLVRNEQAFGRIYEYIVINPLRWAEDSENPDAR